jgi:hypothetical protein
VEQHLGATASMMSLGSFARTLQQPSKANRTRDSVLRRTVIERQRGRPPLAALDDILDKLEERRTDLEADLRQSPDEEEDFDEKVRKLQAEVSPEAVALDINSAFYCMR